MLIVSKYKDFYDWVVFETDNRKVYNRDIISIDIENPRKHEGYYLVEGGYLSILYFCGKKYLYLYNEGDYYWNFDDVPNNLYTKIMKENNKLFKRNNSVFDRFEQKSLGLMYKAKLKWGRFYKENETKEIETTDINKKLNCPIILNESYNKFIFNPKLLNIGFNKVVSPVEVYQEIYNFIPHIEPEIPKSPDDMYRYESKGFDQKTSFRPKMK